MKNGKKFFYIVGLYQIRLSNDTNNDAVITSMGKCALKSGRGEENGKRFETTGQIKQMLRISISFKDIDNGHWK